MKQRASLDMAGFTLVDCPTRNEKETLDKKIIVDVMRFAYSRVNRKQDACVILLSNDGDYAYLLSLLRDIEVQVVVIFDGRPAAALLQACDSSLSWRYDVLQLPAPDRPQSTKSTEGPQAEADHLGNLLLVLERRQRATAKMGTPWEENASTQATLAQHYYRQIGTQDKEKFHMQVHDAHAAGLIEQIAASAEGRGDAKWRLTEAGRNMRSAGVLASSTLRPKHPAAVAASDASVQPTKRRNPARRRTAHKRGQRTLHFKEKPAFQL